jgi:hypothetical protein
MVIVIVSSAAANIFNKKFLTGTKVSIIMFSLVAYVVSLLGSLILYLVEQAILYREIRYGLLP